MAVAIKIRFFAGDYFLNELIEDQDDVHKCIVADVSFDAC